MAFWQHRYPWTSLQEIDLKWIIEKLQNMNTEYQEKLTAGTNITISNDNVISAELEKWTAIQEASGSNITFESGNSEYPYVNIETTIPYKSGGYTGTEIKNMGVNVINPVMQQTSTSRVDLLNPDTSTTLFHLKAGQYTIKNNGFNSYLYWRQNGTNLNNVIHTSALKYGTFTLPDDDDYIFWFYGTNIDASLVTEFIMVAGTTEPAYVEYTENILSVDWSAETNSFYGGTYNFTTGVLTSLYDSSGNLLSDPVTYNLTPATEYPFNGFNTLWYFDGTMSIKYTVDIAELLENVQPRLSAGSNIQIAGNTISATDTTYTAGTGISIAGGVITNTGVGATYTAGTNIQISDQNVISATDTTYTAGTNITIDQNNEISATDTTYTAGTNITISDQNVISATDTTYTAGTNITISDQNVISATSAGGGKTLLWTNASPAANFAAQTVSLDLSDYDAVMIEVRTNTEYDYYPTYEIIKGKESFMNPSLVTAGGVIYVYARLATVAADGITFGTGYYHATNATPTGTNAQMVVPIRIYGLTY